MLVKSSEFHIYSNIQKLLQLISETMIGFLGPQLALLISFVFVLVCVIALFLAARKTVRVKKTWREKIKFFDLLINEVEKKKIEKY